MEVTYTPPRDYKDVFGRHAAPPVTQLFPSSLAIHIVSSGAGYVSIFPLLLKLLPPESQAVGSLLAHMRWEGPCDESVAA